MKEKNTNSDKNNSILYDFERKFWCKSQTVCGIDEVGRGCLAGPVVAVAVILNAHAQHPDLQDSKLLTTEQLEKIYAWIIRHSVYAIGISHNRVIDEKNIYTATQISMKKAVLHLVHRVQKQPDIIVIDAMPLSLSVKDYQSIPILSWTQGESKSASIAAASIIAKVIRDRIMRTMHLSFPSYGLYTHKGYGTREHTATITKYQASVIHRKTFIKKLAKGIEHDAISQQSLFC